MRTVVNLVFDTDNADFAEDYDGTVRALIQDTARQISTRADLTGDEGSIRDSNGNRVGTWMLQRRDN